MLHFKSYLKKLFASWGWELRRFLPSISQSARISSIIRQKNINCVYDVGANTGQFAIGLRSLGYADKIVSFEPLSSAYNELVSAAQDDPNWIIYEQTAVGNAEESVLLNISGNSASSSLLTMLDAHVEADSSTNYIGMESVPMIRLDSLKSQYLGSPTRLLLKIDTQGYEAEVLKGSSDTLDMAEVIICELSLASLYKNQSNWLEIVSSLASRGFVAWSLNECFVHPVTGRVLQMDAIFVREELG
jgi:FkbM family methyltransferase